MTPREWMLVVLACAVATALAMIWRAQRDALVQFDVFDLIMEDGKVSRTAFAFMVVLAVFVWIMIYLTIQGKMTEGYLGIFGTIWVSPLVLKMVFNKTEIPSSTSSTTVVQQTTEVTK